MSLNRAMARGAAWTVGFRVFHRSIGFISTLILARLLVPEDFGVVAMATAIQALLLAFSDFSVHVPLVQKPQIERGHMDSAWTLQAVMGLIQAGVLAALAHPAAGFYEDPRVIPIMYVLAGIALLQGLRNIGVVMFQREMAFHREFKLKAIKRIVGFAVTLALALIFRSYWALVLGMLAGTVTEVALTYGMHAYRPKPAWRYAGELFGFSKWLLVNNVLHFLANRGPDFVLGRLIGPAAVGLFSVGKEVATLPTRELAAPINRAVLPAYSRMHETAGVLQQGYLDVMGMIALIALPAALGVGATADILIPALLGANWVGIIPVAKLLAIQGAVLAMLTNSGVVHMAMGRPWIITALTLLRLLLLVPGMILGAMHFGVVGVAAVYLGAAVLMLPVNLAILFHKLALRFGPYLAAIHRPVLAGAMMYAVLNLWLVPALLPLPLLAGAGLAVSAGAVFYALAVLAMWAAAGRPGGAETRLFQIAAERSDRHAPRVARALREFAGIDNASETT